MKKIFKKIILTPLVLIDFFIKKDSKLVVFSNRGGKESWQGNNAFMFHYIISNEKEYKPYILTDKVSMIHENEVYYLSLKGIVILLKSKVAYFHHGPLDYGIPLLNKKRLNINLNHGIHFKKVGYTLDNYKRMLFETKNVISYHVCSSDTDALAACAYYQTKLSNIRVTGAPKNDAFFRSSCELPKGYQNELQALERCIGGREAILYAPTWREVNQTYEFSNSELQSLRSWLKSNNSVMLFAIHPLIPDYEIPQGDCFIDANAIVSDIQLALRLTDILITDYSTIWIDYLLTEKPIIGFWYDLEQYTKDRGFIFDVRDTFPHEKIHEFNELIPKLEQCMAKEFDVAKHAYLRRFFHKFEDGNNCKRIFQYTKNLLSSVK
ncbi:CDP-glycerol glycerophosphotransferase family protein [Vibrio breoganii]